MMQRRHALKMLGGSAAGLVLGAGAWPVKACGLYPQHSGWRFRVLRHGDVIGAHVFTFSRRDGDFVVEVTIDIAVDLLGITVFRFTHRAEEVWREGRLQALTSDTDDDGRLWRVRAERRDGALRGHVNDAGLNLPGLVVPASLWHRDTTRSPALLDTIDGRMKPVDTKALGAEQVAADGATVEAEHYSLTGQIEREVWYDADCAIARVTFPARDGSRITLERH